MGESDKSIRLVTALVECRPDGEYAPWGIKWYDGTVYAFDCIESYSSRSWALGRNKQSESWRVVVGDGTCRDICHYQNSWYVVHDPDDDTPAASAPQKYPKRPFETKRPGKRLNTIANTTPKRPTWIPARGTCFQAP